MFRPEVTNGDIQQLADGWTATSTWVEGVSHHRLTVAVELASGGRPGKEELARLAAAQGWLENLMIMADPSDEPDHPVFRCVTAA